RVKQCHQMEKIEQKVGTAESKVQEIWCRKATCTVPQYQVCGAGTSSTELLWRRNTTIRYCSGTFSTS
ncbi:hypothetical protein PanWU01x14_352800, partial [Parasponia andersonii]